MSENGRNPGCAKKRQAAWLRASGKTQEETAGHVGVSERTIRRWERGADEAYWTAWEEAREALRRLGWARAWKTLREALQSPNERVQIAAARVIVMSVDGDRPQRLHVEERAEGRVVIYLPEKTPLVEEEARDDVTA